MKISEIYSKATRPVFSFEIFPPKTTEGDNKLLNTIADLKKLSPSFISVTYGAGGSTKDKTIDICENIQSQFQITTMEIHRRSKEFLLNIPMVLRMELN